MDVSHLRCGGVCFAPVSGGTEKLSALAEAWAIHSVTIFLVEFAAGGLIRLATGVCPWDYGNNPLSVLGLIRLDYAPLWAALGCFFEEVSLLLAKKGELA